MTNHKNKILVENVFTLSQILTNKFSIKQPIYVAAQANFLLYSQECLVTVSKLKTELGKKQFCSTLME